MSLLDSLFDGMETPAGLLAGSASLASIAGPFFPMFTSLKRIFPPPQGWGAWEAATLATFVCLAIKTFLHTFGRGSSFRSETIAACGFMWLLALFVHYPGSTPTPYYEHDPTNLVFYFALFALPTFAFTAMQLQAANGRH